MTRQATDLSLKRPFRYDGDSGNDSVRPSGRPKALLSVDEAAEMLGQSRSSLYRAIHTGETPFPVYKIGTFRILIPSLQSKGCSMERRRHGKRAEP